MKFINLLSYDHDILFRDIKDDLTEKNKEYTAPRLKIRYFGRIFSMIKSFKERKRRWHIDNGNPKKRAS